MLSILRKNKSKDSCIKLLFVWQYSSMKVFQYFPSHQCIKALHAFLAYQMDVILPNIEYEILNFCGYALRSRLNEYGHTKKKKTNFNFRKRMFVLK